MEAHALRSGAPPARMHRVPVRRFASDERLVERVRAGDDLAFEALFDRYHRPILSFCRHMLGSAEEAEDAVQQSFLSAFRAMRRDGDALRVRPWLYTIARNQCLSMLRARREHSPIDDDEPSVAGLAAEVQQREDLKDMLRDMARLPAQQRAALVLSELGALSHDEIADVVGCPKGKVKALVFQARSSLAASREARQTPCHEIREQLSTLSGGALRRSLLSRHVRECDGCRAFREDVRRQRAAMAVLLPVMPSAGLKSSVLSCVGIGGGGSGTAGGIGATAAAIGGGTAATGAGAGGLATWLAHAGAVKAVAAAAAAATALGGAYSALREPGDAAPRPAIAQKAAADPRAPLGDDSPVARGRWGLPGPAQMVAGREQVGPGQVITGTTGPQSGAAPGTAPGQGTTGTGTTGTGIAGTGPPAPATAPAPGSGDDDRADRPRPRPRPRRGRGHGRGGVGVGLGQGVGGGRDQRDDGVPGNREGGHSRGSDDDDGASRRSGGDDEDRGEGGERRGSRGGGGDDGGGRGHARRDDDRDHD